MVEQMVDPVPAIETRVRDAERALLDAQRASVDSAREHAFAVERAIRDVAAAKAELLAELSD